MQHKSQLIKVKRNYHTTLNNKITTTTAAVATTTTNTCQVVSYNNFEKNYLLFTLIPLKHQQWQLQKATGAATTTLSTHKVTTLHSHKHTVSFQNVVNSKQNLHHNGGAQWRLESFKFVWRISQKNAFPNFDLKPIFTQYLTKFLFLSFSKFY